MAKLVEDRFTITDMKGVSPIDVGIDEGGQTDFITVEQGGDQVWLDKAGAQILVDNLPNLIDKL